METPIPVVVDPTAPERTKVSAKVWASTIGTLVVSLVLALLTAVVNDPATLQQVLDAVPSWLRFILVAILPTLVTFLAGYAKRDKTRELGAAVEAGLREQAATEPDPEQGGQDHLPAEYTEPNGDADAL